MYVCMYVCDNLWCLHVGNLVLDSDFRLGNPRDEMAAEREGKVPFNYGIGLSAITTAFGHPLTFVKVLVQV